MTREASFTFTTPLTVNLVEIKGEEHLFVEGDISTTDIDLVNDIMTKECQESMQRQIMERNMKLDLEHEAFRGETHEEKEINKTKIPIGKLIDATVKDLGNERFSTRVKGEINRHRADYKEVKGNLLERYLDAFSVAFLPTDVKYQDMDGKDISFEEYKERDFDERKRLLNDVILLNVALTGNPCNTKAQMVDIFTKSMDAVEEYKKLKEVNPDVEKHLNVKSHSTGIPGNAKLNTKDKEMTEDQKNPEPAPEEPETEEPETGDESPEAEQKAIDSVSTEMKSLKEKFAVVEKTNSELKDAVSKIAEAVEKITKALEKPIHKSPGIQKSDAEVKANATQKSVDPLDAFKS